MVTGVVGAVEAGGTKIVCGVGTGPDDLREVTRFPTTEPGETLGRVLAFLRDAGERHGGLVAVGVGSFGPVDPDPASPTYGRILSTPKPGWSGTDVVGPVHEALGVPVAFDTDVNAAAVGEGRWGAARGLDSFLYLTVGTGIGGGAMVEGRLLHGFLHPEMGHVRIPRDPGEEPDDFAGACPYHGDCLEGLASGPALEARWGRPPRELPEDHPAWDLEASYLARGVVNHVLTLAPRRVVMGGGIMKRREIFPVVRRRLRGLLGGYVDVPELEDLESYVVPPGLGDRSGLLGALALGALALGAEAAS